MFSNMKLGCLPPKHDPRTLKLAKYLAPSALPAPPAQIGWQSKVPQWGVMLNDRIGCCTIAAAGHMDQLWSSVNGAPVVPSDQQVLAEYEAVSGYDPNTGANDNGAAILDVMNRWRQLGLFGRKIGAYAAVSMHDHNEVATAIWLMGAINVGVQLPLAWQGTMTWDVPRHRLRFWQHWQWSQGSWGGHDVPIFGYDAQFLYAISWGQVVRITWEAWDAYFVEGYAAIDALWVDGTKPAPSGFDLNALAADLQAIGAN